MRNLLPTLGVVAAVCAAAFAVSYFADPRHRALHAAAQEGDAMAWLRVEFRLNDTQFSAIERLHEDFSVECSRHCAAIMEARERRAPAAGVAALEKHCVDAMTAHFRQVAALMPPGQGERYLAVVLPRVAGYSHEGAPNVRATP
jgi:hypothetical protein